MVTLYRWVCRLGEWSMERMVPWKLVSAEETVTSARPPTASLATRDSDTAVAISMSATESTVTTGALGATKVFLAALRARMLPEMGATTLPFRVMLAREASSWVMVAWAFWMLSSSWLRAEFMPARAFSSCNLALSSSSWEAAPAASRASVSATFFSAMATCCWSRAD